MYFSTHLARFSIPDVLVPPFPETPSPVANKFPLPPLFFFRYLGSDMKIAILSDIHSNLEALLKTFTILDDLRIEEIYCLGDIVGYGGSPNECVNLIRKRASRCVLGNHDLAAIDTSHASYFTKPGRIAAEWTHEVLTSQNLDYLSSLPYRLDTEFGTIVHANPARPEEWEYIV